MKHLASIQSEFLKEARKWDDLSYDEQKGYLKRHPKSKRKLTAKPESSTESKDVANNNELRSLLQSLQKVSPGLRDSYRGEIFNAVNYMNNNKITIDKDNWDQLPFALDMHPYDIDRDYSNSKPKSESESTPSKKKDKKDISKKIEEKKSQLAFSTPKLDGKLSKLYDMYSSDRKAILKNDSKESEKFEKLWKKEFPKETVSAADILYEAERSMGLHKDENPRTKKLSKDEFIQAIKDVASVNDGRLPIVEGEEDPTKKIVKKYGLNAPFTSKEMNQVNQLEKELPDDEKQYAKYLVISDRDENFDEKRTLADTNSERPIIKSTYTHPNFGETTTFLVPTSTRKSAEISDIGAGQLEYARFDNINDAKKYIGNADELERKAKLRDEISKITDDTRKQYDKAFNKIGFFYTSSVANFLRSMKNRKNLKLSNDSSKNLAKVLTNPTISTTDEIEKAIKDFPSFVKDVETNKDIDMDTAKFLKSPDTIKNALEALLPKMKLVDKLRDQHGYEKSKADLKLPEGFKFKDHTEFGQEPEDAITIGDKDDTMEMTFTLGIPGDYGRYQGEVFYKVPGQKGVYSLGRRGIDIGFSADWNDLRSFEEIIKDYANQVKQKQDSISKSVDVPVAGGVWKVTPENIEQIKKILLSGKSYSFAPHGMGTGYMVGTKPSRYSVKADEKTEKALGVSPLYYTSYDHD